MSNSFSNTQLAELLFIGAVLPESLSEKSPESRSIVPNSKIALKKIFESVENLIEKEKKFVFKMSGGLDTRILAYVLSEICRLPAEIHVICHPDLSAEEDQDVVIAKQVIETLKLDYPLIIQKMYPHQYLKPFGENDCQLTGIFGTEILGGLMFDILPVCSRLKIFGQEAYLNLINVRYRKHVKEIIEKYIVPEEIYIYSKIFCDTARSNIYESTGSGWAEPDRFKKRSLAPFASDTFLNYLSLFQSDDIKKYKLYHEIFQLLPSRVREIPLCSDYKNFYNHPVQIPPKSINAKSLKSKEDGIVGPAIKKTDHSAIIKEFFVKDISLHNLHQFRSALECLQSAI